MGIAVGGVLLWASIGIIRQSVDILLEAAPRDLDLVRLKQEVDAHPGAINMHHIHAWTLTSSRTVVSAHVLVEESSDADLLEQITELLRTEYGAYFSTIQLERTCVGEQPSEIDFLQTVPEGEMPEREMPEHRLPEQAMPKHDMSEHAVAEEGQPAADEPTADHNHGDH